MASPTPTLLHFLLAVSIISGVTQAQLSTKFYSTSCHNLQDIVWAKMKHAVDQERRIGASLLRLFFHDCFVQGCDASVLLDGAGGEKWAEPNANSLRGFEIVDAIKASVEAACPGVVSCADILALAARDGTSLLGGPYWDVQLGRRDSTTASKSLAEANLPGAGFSLAELISLFARHRLTPTDLTVLSGAHTLGMARCHSFRGRIYNDTNIDASYATALRRTCPRYGGDGNLAPMDVRTPVAFDAAYFQNLMSRRGLLHSDQVLFNGGSQDSLVRRYSGNPALFRDDFAGAMVKMGNINPLTGAAGQIRKNCRIVNH